MNPFQYYYTQKKKKWFNNDTYPQTQKEVNATRNIKTI